MSIQHWYLHADLDAFFASVEQLDHPEYRGKPLIVGGLPEDPRSVVSTASYEARKYGVHSAMPTREAYRLCPQGIFVHGNHHRYEEVSWQIMEIFKRWSPDVQQMSIDEAFIDLTGTERLFGPPEETALKIKKQVFEETGLTISIGLACTKYFAKLSSEINKPDGFYFMKPGTETDYMLSIPIEKIWGIGKRTSERIKDAGLKTTRQIYETDISTLNFLFGENTADFLYNILRGKADDMFGTEAKTHSLSNERTFPFDITDAYACETALLELAHSVMFRMLRENLHSRTVVIKIRYDDFSTVSARQTFETDIITLDSFFEKVRDLFNKKYERTRGVRLLGVGFDNVHSEESTYQQNLFDDGQKKKQAVEKAILKFEKKYPDLPVQKARVIKPKNKGILAFIFISALSLFSVQNLNAASSNLLDEPDIHPLPSETPAVLFDISRDDKKIEILSSGYWKAEVTDTAAFTFGNGTTPGFSFGVPVFKQDVNLDFSLIYNKQWFFKTAFAEQFKKNTVAFGFENGSTVKKALLSNRNIVYPDNYSSALFGFNPYGGSNQSPGLSVNMAGENWQADFLLRYDITQKKEAVYYGSNQVNDINISPSAYISGRFFTLPEGFVNKVSAIYIESSDGKILSEDGRKFTKISKSRYSLVSSENLILLSREAVSSESSAKPYILVSFDSEKTLNELLQKAGSFDKPESFLGNIQKVFSKSREVNLSAYWNKTMYEIDGANALILQTGKKFSPYENTSFYDCGLVSESDFIVQSETTELEKENYRTNVTDINFLFSGNDYFNEKHQYYNITSLETDDETVCRFPFATEDPDIYLLSESNSDISLLLRTYSPVSSFQIPVSASAGSVRVTVNGIQDNGITFDKDTGFVNLSLPYSESDRIVISWNEEGTDFKSGVFTAAAGIKNDLTPNLKTNLDITSSWPLFASEKYSDSDESLQGYVSLNGGINYEKAFFKIQNSSSISYSNDNTSGKLIIYSGTSQIPETHYLSGSSVNTLSNISESTNPDLKDALSCSPEKIIVKKDQEISGYAVPVEFDFTAAGTKKGFTGCEIKTYDGENSHTFTIALKPEFEHSEELQKSTEVYLQLGIISENENAVPSAFEIPVKEITGLIDFSSNTWQEISVTLSEEYSAHLSEYKNIRLIAVKKENISPEAVTGTLFAGPYEFQKSAVKTEASKGIISKTTEYENGKENITELRWESSFSTETPSVKVSDYFKAADFNPYDTINFDFRLKNLSENLSDSDECNAFVCTFYRNQNQVLETGISAAILQNSAQNPEEWHTFSYSLSEKCIYIDSTKVGENQFFVSDSDSLIPNKFQISINGFESGCLELKEIYYKGNCSSFTVQNRLETKLEKNVHSLSFASNLKKSLITGDAFYTDASASGKTVLKALQLSGDIKVRNSASVLETAGHSVSLNKPLLGLFTVSENYRFSPYVKTAEKNRNASLNLSKIKLPLSFTVGSKQKDIISGYKGSTDTALLLNTKYISGKINYSNKEEIKKQETAILSAQIQDSKYFSSYGTLEKYFFNFGNPEAALRNQDYKSSLSINLPFAALKPEAVLTVSDSYSSGNGYRFTDKENFTFSVPLSVKNNGFNFSWTKESEDSDLFLYGGNYKTDTEKLFALQSERLYFYKAAPFADLCLPAPEGNYSTDYKLSWNRPFSNSIKDLFLPSFISLNGGRIILKEDSLQDFYQAKLTASQQAFNLFGSESSRKLFSWYKTDETASSLEVTVKTPSGEPENTIYSFSAYLQMVFYIKSGNSLKTAGDLFIQTNGDWTSRQTGIYSSTVNKSPLDSVVRLMANNKISETKISRKETFNAEFGKTEEINYQSYSFLHHCEVSFLTNYSVYTDAEASFIHKKNKGDTLGISLTLGGKITY